MKFSSDFKVIGKHPDFLRIIEKMLTERDLASRGVFFLVAHPNAYSHVLRCLVQGLTRLGIPTGANLHDWKDTTPKPGAVEFNDAAVVLIDVPQVQGRFDPQAIIKDLTELQHPHKIVLSQSDTNNHTLFGKLPALMAHLNTRLATQGMRIPWGFGLEEQQISQLEGGPPLSQRNRSILRNFRPTINQGVRQALDLGLVPHLEEHFAIDRHIDDGELFVDDYVRKLKSTYGCLAYGGHFFEDLRLHPHLREGLDMDNLAHFEFKDPVVVTRWDSWRFWESLAAGTLTFQLDFETYGLDLLERPVAWQHYVPVQFSDPGACVRRVVGDPQGMAEIAAAGAAWMREKYSPLAQAVRFLQVALATYGRSG